MSGLKMCLCVLDCVLSDSNFFISIVEDTSIAKTCLTYDAKTHFYIVESISTTTRKQFKPASSMLETKEEYRYIFGAVSLADV